MAKPHRISLDSKPLYHLARCNFMIAESFNVALRDIALTIRQLRVLLALAEGDGLHMRDLAERALVNPSTLSRTITRMLSDGWVRREAISGDRRKVRVVLAPAGITLLDRALAPFLAQEAKIERAFSAQEIGLISSLTEKAGLALSRHVDPLDAVSAVSEPGSDDPIVREGSSTIGGDHTVLHTVRASVWSAMRLRKDSEKI